MARPLRLSFPGGLYHVMSRGNERRAIVRDDADRARRIEWYRRTVDAFGWRVHAFVLMTNHDHLFVETPQANLSEGMRHLNASYAGYFNARHRRVGHVFQGRFKAQIVENEGHYLEISRYIHLNPVRARMVERPEMYPWGSCRGYYRKADALDWVIHDRVLADFGPGADIVCRRRYRSFIEAALADPPSCPWGEADGGLIVGSRAFIDRVRERISAMNEDPDRPGIRRLKLRPGLDAIVRATERALRQPVPRGEGRRDNSPARAIVCYLARHRFGYTGREIAEHLGLTRGASATRAARVIAGSTARYAPVLAKIERLTGG